MKPSEKSSNMARPEGQNEKSVTVGWRWPHPTVGRQGTRGARLRWRRRPRTAAIPECRHDSPLMACTNVVKSGKGGKNANRVPRLDTVGLNRHMAVTGGSLHGSRDAARRRIRAAGLTALQAPS